MSNSPTPRFITPASLEADTTIPQCLDNQFVSGRIFSMMAQNPALDYESPDIAEERAKQASAEFWRALVYSSQVVVNRAFFVNSPILFNNYLPGNPDGVRAFSSLLSGNGAPQAIVPYLHTA